MTLETRRPAPGDGGGPRKHVSGQGQAQDNPKGRKPQGEPRLTFRLSPDGEPMTVDGREAQTLALLLTTGPRGFTAGEASPLGWARRTAAYVHNLRRMGLPVVTERETTADGAVVARYSLSAPVVVVGKGSGQ